MASLRTLAPAGFPLKDIPGFLRGVRVDQDALTGAVVVRPCVAFPSPAGTRDLGRQIEQVAARAAAGAMAQPPLSLGSELVASVSACVERTPAAHARQVMARVGGGVAHVASIIAVYSCKGGVGKSTVAVNLAAALSRLGARVGLLDADVAGPSLPTMVRPEDDSVHLAGAGEGGGKQRMLPVRFRGLRCMSYGWVAPRDPATGKRGGVPMRGPRVSTVVSQLALGTEWGELDHLIIDMPPGTGDIHLTLGQSLPITATVMVTTPQALALADVEKGLQLFQALNIPTVALVVNMAHFDGADGRRYHPLGDGAAKLRASGILDRFPIPRILELPMEAAISEACDVGEPAALGVPLDASGRVAEEQGSVAAAVHFSLADAVGAHVNAVLLAEAAAGRRQEGQARQPGAPLPPLDPNAAPGAPPSSALQAVVVGDGTVVRYSVDSARLEVGDSGVPARVLRLACRCAACIDENTGEVRLQESRVPASVAPVSLRAQGNYGVAVSWSDGHASSIYSLAQLRSLSSSRAAGDGDGGSAAGGGG